MAINEGSLDRAVRMTLGIPSLALGFSSVVDGAVGVALIVIGVVLLVTGPAGRCPIYRTFHWSTARREQGEPEAWAP